MDRGTRVTIIYVVRNGKIVLNEKTPGAMETSRITNVHIIAETIEWSYKCI